jgi:hypothetical protein
MEVAPYDPARRAEWDEFVHSNPLAGTGHLSGQFVLNESLGSGTNRSLMLYEERELVGVLPLYLTSDTQLQFLKVRSISSPGAAGPLLKASLPRTKAKEGMNLLMKSMQELARETKADRITVSYPSVIGGMLAVERFGVLPLRTYGFHETNMAGWYIDLRQSENELFAQLEHKCRNMVRRAKRSGAEIVTVQDRAAWLSCESLVEETFGSMKYSRKTLEIIWDEFVSKGLAFVNAVTFEGRILNVVVTSIFNQVAYYWYSFNKKQSPVPGGNNAVVWHAMLQNRSLGCRFFLVGTLYFEADEKNLNIVSFKRSFGGTPYYVMGGTLNLRRGRTLFLELATEWRNGLRNRLRRLRSEDNDALHSSESHTW